MAKRFLITVTELDETQLSADKLKFSDVPAAFSASIEQLAPHGALCVQRLYLLNEDQKAFVEHVLEHHALPYPELLQADVAASGEPETPRLAAVVYLHDRRLSPKDPHSPA